MPRHSRYLRHRRYIRHDRHDPFQRVTAAGAVQYSNDGSTSWGAAIAAADLKVATAVDYYVRLNPASTLPADNGSYKYNFQLIGTADGNGGMTAGIGGLSLTWQGNLAHITGQVPADQVGKKITIAGTVKDVAGNTFSGTSLVGTWTA